MDSSGDRVGLRDKGEEVATLMMKVLFWPLGVALIQREGSRPKRIQNLWK